MKQINLFLKTAIIILFLFFNKGFAQNPNWAMLYEYLKPSGLNPLPGGAFPPMDYAANMIADQNGNLQFFIYDGEVIDRNGNTIANLSWSKRVHPNNYYVKSYTCYGTQTINRNDYYLIGGDFNVTGYADVCVLPSPVDCKKYFMFSSGTPSVIPPNPGADGGIYNFTVGRFLPFYAVLDVSPYSTGGTPTLQQFSETQATLVYNAPPCSNSVPSTGYYTMGSNTTLNNNTKELFTQLYPTSTPAKSKGIYWAAAPKVGTGSTAYNYVFMFDGSSLYTFKVDASGVNYISSSEFLVPGASNNSIFRSELEVVKLSSGNYQLGFTFEGSSPVNIATVEFNASGLPLSSTFASKIVGGSATPTAHIRGLEFTPDGSKLVFTNTTNSNITTRVNYIASPYTSSTVTAVPSIPANTDLSKSQIEIRYTGSTPYMYFATTNVLMSLNVSSSTPSSWVWNSSAVTAPSGYSFGPASSSAYGMGNPQQETFLLPDQMDGVDYSAYQNEGAACCYFYSNLNIKEPITLPVGTYTVTNNTPLNCTNTITGAVVPVTFSSTTISTGNITVPVGSKYTFQNLIIKFAPNTGMIVNANIAGQQGGKVVLNASTLTWYTDCGESVLWNGVTLNGCLTNPAQGSTSSSPHAVLTTVGVSQIDHALTALNIKGGAIVQYTGGSKLLDNKVAIEAEAYPYTATNDVGIFNNVTIKTQSTFTSVPNGQMSYLVRVTNRKPTFRFQNTTIIDDNSMHKQLYDGVVSDNSAISFSSNTNISNFRWGIYHTNSALANLRRINISYCTFNSNLMGVYVGLCNYATINNSTFNIVDNTTLQQWPYGLFLDQSSKFAVANNTFQCPNYPPNISGPGGTGDAGGLWVRNSNLYEANINIIRSNTFTKLDNGVVNMDKNYTVVAGSPTNQVGLRYYCNTFTSPITWQDFLINSGTIDYNQGVGDTTAKNSFSHDGFFGDMVANMSAVPPSTFVHYIYKGIGTAYDPIINSPSNTYIFDFNLTATDKNTCGAGGGGERLADGTLEPSDYLENINRLKTSINQITGQNNKNDGQDSLSLEEKEALSLWMERLQSSQNALIMHYLNDSITVGAIDSAAKYVHLFANDEKELFGYYIETSQLKKAASSLDLIRENEPADSKYTEVCEIMYDLADKDFENEMLSNPSLEQQLIQLTNDDSDQRSYLIARNILNKINHIYGPYPVNFTTHTATERRAMEEAKAIKNETYLSNYPNPFTGKTTLTAFVPKGSSSAAIVITDLLGKVVAKFDLTEGNNSVEFDKQEVKGILYYSLFIDGARKETKMMMKQ